MNVDDYFLDLHYAAVARAEAENQYLATAFMAEVGDRLMEAEEIDNLIPVHFEGTGQRKRRLAVSGYDLSDPDSSVALAVLVHRGSDTLETISTQDIRRAFASLRSFLEESLSGAFQTEREESTPEWQLAADLRHRGGTVVRYRLYLVTDSRTSERLRELPSDDIGGIPVDYRIWDVSRLHQLNESLQGRENLDMGLLHDQVTLRVTQPDWLVWS